MQFSSGILLLLVAAGLLLSYNSIGFNFMTSNLYLEFTVAVIAGYLVYVYIEKPLVAVSKKWLGRKNKA